MSCFQDGAERLRQAARGDLDEDGLDPAGVGPWVDGEHLGQDLSVQRVQRHKKAKYLVIDLRENTGGSGFWGYCLLDYLVDSPYLIAKDFAFKVSDTMRKSGYADKAGDLIHRAKDGEYLNQSGQRLE
jgi:hypothetical protein